MRSKISAEKKKRPRVTATRTMEYYTAIKNNETIIFILKTEGSPNRLLGEKSKVQNSV